MNDKDRDNMEFPDILEEYRESKRIYQNEGTNGVRNLCKLVRAIGYKDFQHFGQFEGACYGDLIEFLEDNSGAVDAIVEWISENGGNDDWEENLLIELDGEQDDV